MKATFGGLLFVLCLGPFGAWAEEDAREVVVDASAPAPGLGTVRKPYRDLRTALASGATRVRLRSGLYSGPFELGDGVLLQGEGEVVLFAEGDASFVLSTKGKVQLKKVSVSGGQVGLVSEGNLSLEDVAFSAFRKAGVVTEGALDFEKGEVRGAVSETIGIQSLGPASKINLRKVRFVGALRRGVEAKEGEVSLADCTFEGPVTAVHQRGGNLSLTRLMISNGRGPAVFSAGGFLRIESMVVRGHEYALQTGRGARVDVRDLSSVRAERAGVAFSGTEGVLRDVVIWKTGNFGGVQLIDSTVQLERIRIHDAQSFGLFARGGAVDADDIFITDVKAEGVAGQRSGGDGIQFYGGKHRLGDVQVLNVQGSGVLSSMAADTRIQDLSCISCQWGGLVVEQLSTLEAASVVVERSSVGVALPTSATAHIGHLHSFENIGGPFWVECQEGTALKVGLVTTDLQLNAPSCVSVQRWSLR